MLNVTARPNVMHSYYTERQFYVKLNYITRKLHTLSSTLPAAANNILATALPSSPADQQLRVPQHCLDQQKQKPETFPEFRSCATFPICARQVCVGSDELALLHSTPTPQSTAIIFPCTISRSHPHFSLSARVLLTKGMNRPTSQRHTHLYHKTYTWINLSF